MQCSILNEIGENLTIFLVITLMLLGFFFFTVISPHPPPQEANLKTCLLK